MKYLIVGDFHGKGKEYFDKFREYIEAIDPDVIISLGDYDQVKTIKEFKKIGDEYNQKGAEIIEVPGNHDEAILNGHKIYSSELRKQRKTFEELYFELREDPEAYEYTEKLVNSDVDKEFNIKGKKYDYKAVAVHGGYGGDLSSFPTCPPELQKMWFRIETIDDMKENFSEMEKRGISIMVRGHDHEPMYSYKDPKKGIVVYDPEKDGEMYRLFEQRRHIINPGAFANGWFAVIDTEFPEENHPILIYYRI